MYGLVLIAVLAIMGGIIAYIGDKLGSKVGKRKLTLFGLRPKHTSIVVTIITGITIAAATLGVMALASKDVRTALFGMEALKAELSSLSQEVAARNVELDSSRKELEVKTQEYSALTAKVNETATNLAKVTGELSEVMAQRDRTAAALVAVQADFAMAKGDLNQARQDIQTLQATKDELDSRVASLNESKTQLQSDVDRLDDLTSRLKQGIQTVREGIVIYRAGEVLSTSVLKNGQSLADTQNALAAVIGRTNEAILNKLNVADKDLDVLWISQADFDQAAALIATSPENVIIRISSSGNTIYGEPVIGQLALFPNRLVYAAGEVIYSQTIEVSGDKAEEAVLVFLQKVNTLANNRGILADPLQGTVGVMSGSQLFDTINKVKHYGGLVELTAVTRADMYTAGPLRIEIRVRSLH